MASNVQSGYAMFNATGERLVLVRENAAEPWRTVPYPKESQIPAFMRNRVGRAIVAS